MQTFSTKRIFNNEHFVKNRNDYFNLKRMHYLLYKAIDGVENEALWLIAATHQLFSKKLCCDSILASHM